MNNDNLEIFNEEINECTARGACSIAPNIAALQELVMYFIRQTAFYLLKLEKLGANWAIWVLKFTNWKNMLFVLICIYYE